MFANPVRNVNVNPSLPWWCTKKSLFRFKLNGVVHMFTVISIFCSNKWQARNQVFLTGRYDPTRRETKRGRRSKSLGGVGGGGGGRGITLPETAFQDIWSRCGKKTGSQKAKCGYFAKCLNPKIDLFGKETALCMHFKNENDNGNVATCIWKKII